jgi:hypothetical protein
VAHLIPAARAARAALADDGRRLSRDALADAMRDDGHSVSNERASLLVKILKAEQDVTPLAPPGDGARRRGVARREAGCSRVIALLSSTLGALGAQGATACALHHVASRSGASLIISMETTVRCGRCLRDRERSR